MYVYTCIHTYICMFGCNVMDIVTIYNISPMAIIACDIMNKYTHVYMCYSMNQHPCIMQPLVDIKR